MGYITKQKIKLENKNESEKEQIIEKHILQGTTIMRVKFNNDKYTLKRFFVDRRGQPAVFANRSKTWGTKIDKLPLKDMKEIYVLKNRPIEDEWKKTLIKGKKILEKSGLWKEILQNINAALEIGYEKLNEAYKTYWKEYPGDYKDYERQRAEAIEKISKKLITVNDKGEKRANTDIIWYMHNPIKIKCMYFGKHVNKKIISELKEAMNNKREYRTKQIDNYDVSVQYNPKINKAWYSEEFRGCGNGHYFLALDYKHAMFYEDD